MTEGYGQDFHGRQLAIEAWQRPKVDPGELEQLAAFKRRPSPPTFACSRCGRFAFAKPTVCHWCRG